VPIEQIGAGGMSVELKQFYDRKLLERALPNLVHTKYGQTRPIPKNGGKSIEIRKMTRITINTSALTEGTPPTETVATFTNITATISQYGMYSKISDILDLQSYDPVVAEYTENYGEVMGDVIDQVVRDVIAGGTTIQYASTAETLGAATGVGSGMFLDSAEIREAVNTLKRNNIKPVMEGKYVMIIHPDVTRDLFADPNIVDAFQHAAPRGDNNPLFSGVLGDYMGVRFVETTNAKVQSSLGLSGADVYNCLLIGKDAYAVTELSAQQARMYIQKPGGVTDPLEQYMTVGWKAALTAVILDQNAIVNVKVNSSRSLSA
jgi:N4-gp56 family major capsid protein